MKSSGPAHFLKAMKELNGHPSIRSSPEKINFDVRKHYRNLKENHVFYK